MAKKAVATFRDGSKTIKPVKCIGMTKSKKTNAYMFKEGFVPADKVDEFFTSIK